MHYIVDGFAWVGAFTLSLICLLLFAGYIGRHLKRNRVQRDAIRDIGSSGSSGLRGGRGDPLSPGRQQRDLGDDRD